MSKVTKAEESALQVMTPGNLLPTAAEMDEGFIEPSNRGEYLPLVEMVFPIMQTPEKPFYANKNYKIGFKHGAEFETLPAGVIITTIDKRNVIRQKTDEGNVYSYAEIVRGENSCGSSHEAFKALLPKANTQGIDLGVSAVVAMIFPDGKVVIGNFSAWRTMHGYIMPLLCATKIQSKAGLRIDIEDHTPNLVKSKASGHYYPDHKKFKQYSQVVLTDAQLSAIRDAVNASAAAYGEWLKK